MIRVAGGQGFYGDHVGSIRELLEEGVEYLCLEALAELTLAILAKDRQKDPAAGYTKDLPAYLKVALPYVAKGGTKLITNAGGINVTAAAQVAQKVAREAGLQGLRIAAVTGDDIKPRLNELEGSGASLQNVDTQAGWSSFPGEAIFANAYLGAKPIVEALRQGAQVVITGRVADASLFLAPLIYEFGWSFDDWHKLAAGTLMGHLCECSGQSTGGNFSGEWWSVPKPWHFAYPIAECEADGSFVLTKAQNAGGLVSFDTVRQQLLYEVHDPKAYLTPDVTADFTSATLTEAGPNRVKVTGVQGAPAPATLKALLAHEAGYAGEVRCAFAWPDAYAKARAAADIFRRRVEAAKLPVEEWLAEYFGVNALHGPTVPTSDAAEAPEVVLRMAWRCKDGATAGKVGREFAPLALSAPPWGLTTFGRGIADGPSQMLGLWPTHIERGLIESGVRVTVATT